MIRILVIIAVAFVCAISSAEQQNLAMSASVKASSTLESEYAAKNVIDGKVSDSSRWLSSEKAKEEEWIEFQFPASFQFEYAHVYSGYEKGSAVDGFLFQHLDQSSNQWKYIPGSMVTDNPEGKTFVQVKFSRPVETIAIRMMFLGKGVQRVREVALFAPSNEGQPRSGTGVSFDRSQAKNSNNKLPPVDMTKHHVLVNQMGYNIEWAKGFTAPNSPDGSIFTLIDLSTNSEVFEGTIKNGKGDFSEYRPDSSSTEYLIQVSGKGLNAGKSYPFWIRDQLAQRTCLEPALRFMIDSRSITGTHPSAYGAGAWRDGTYYTYELPSLVLMYLANPHFFETAEIETSYAKDRKKVLDPDFKLVKMHGDKGALQAARDYYKNLDPPVGDRVPDIIHLIHFGTGYHLSKPVSKDPSGDPLGEKLHPETLEQLAFFLYGYPAYKDYFTNDFYEAVRNYTFSKWEEVGLLKIITTVGSPKGRHGPGHSIAPNVMMYEVAKREGRSDAMKYLKAAAAQAEWHIKNLDPTDPRIAKGQRLSEHKPYTGFFMLKKKYPRYYPKGTDQWLKRWAKEMIARSDNPYDFRKFTHDQWTLPKPWSDPGGVAGFPGIVVAVDHILDRPDKLKDLQRLKASHFDTLFGRNPVNAASANRAEEAFPGLEFGWPYHYGHGICACLELCRGTLNTLAANEHYPFNPNAPFRHPEGWTGFNAALNVSLAFICWEQTNFHFENSLGETIHQLKADDSMQLVLIGPLGSNPSEVEQVRVKFACKGKPNKYITLTESRPDSLRFSAEIKMSQIGLEITKQSAFSYGSGLFKNQIRLNPIEDREILEVSNLH